MGKQPLIGYTQQTWIVFISAAIITQLIGYMAISYCLGNLPASVVSPSLNLQPVVAIILAIPLLGEFLSTSQVIGSLLPLGGVYIIDYAHQQIKQICLKWWSIILLANHSKDCPDYLDVAFIKHVI